ncbi:hypothetical protein RND81_08G157200 [Saponaria officinalis]|uniref:BHLH domain-containing protein n=1 Tax=Saponaria officinalis TaxID=3572 RepID=A0AAW1J7V4_SAPOF
MDYTTSYNPTYNSSSPSSNPNMISSTYTTNNKTNSNISSNSNNNKTKGGKGGVRLSTDPQSVAARQRRHRISERFKMLQSLVPGGDKLDTVSMLEQTIQYVKFLKSQLLLHQTLVNNSSKFNTCATNFNYDHHDYSSAYYYNNNNYDINTSSYYEMMWNNNCSGGGGGGHGGGQEVNVMGVADTQATPTHVQGFSFGYQLGR